MGASVDISKYPATIDIIDINILSGGEGVLVLMLSFIIFKQKLKRYGNHFS